MASFTGWGYSELSGGGSKVGPQNGTNVTITTTGATNYILGDTTGTARETFAIGTTTYTYQGTATAGGVNGFYATSGNKTYFFYKGTGPVNNTSITLQADTATTNRDFALCLYPGTLVRTPDGEVAVETLAIGDLVLTAEGEARPVRWLGRQTVSTLFADPLRVLPVRILAGALGEGLPARDLLVSPDHALLVDGVLIHAGALVNGSSIRREAEVPGSFTYYHVELADHSLILAEGVPAETFVDNVDRLAFDNWDEHQALYGHEAPIAEMALPRAKAERQVPMATRQRLAARAEELLGATAAAA